LPYIHLSLFSFFHFFFIGISVGLHSTAESKKRKKGDGVRDRKKKGGGDEIIMVQAVLKIPPKIYKVSSFVTCSSFVYIMLNPFNSN